MPYESVTHLHLKFSVMHFRNIALSGFPNNQSLFHAMRFRYLLDVRVIQAEHRPASPIESDLRSERTPAGV